MKLIFATNNPNKVREIRAALPDGFTILSLPEAGIEVEIPEPHDTLEANAAEKARTISRMTGTDCFSEDTGLEVDALGGEPGVRSARYAGDSSSASENTALLLHRLKGRSDRRARFRTVICLLMGGKEYFFEGICEGSIAESPCGNEGFGYDPVFIPDGGHGTFAQMTLEEKNQFSHRKKALSRLVTFLNHLSSKTQ